jgi:hypothetical protein
MRPEISCGPVQPKKVDATSVYRRGVGYAALVSSSGPAAGRPRARKWTMFNGGAVPRIIFAT